MNRQKIQQRIEELEAGVVVLQKWKNLQFRADEIHTKQEIIRELQSLLDEPEQEPLDAPTHSGWWWNSKAGLILYLGMVENGFAEGDVKYYDFKERFPRFHIAPDVPDGKWLPANNPFGEGEG